MTDPGTDFVPMNLVLLSDEEGNSVCVRVLGPYPKDPEAPGLPAMLKAELILDTTFVSGREELALWASRLGEWERVLAKLEAGEDAGWMTVGSGLSLSIELQGKRDCPEVVVEEVTTSMVTVRVPMDLPEDWIPDHRRRLNELRSVWP